MLARVLAPPLEGARGDRSSALGQLRPLELVTTLEPDDDPSRLVAKDLSEPALVRSLGLDDPPLGRAVLIRRGFERHVEEYGLAGSASRYG